MLKNLEKTLNDRVGKEHIVIMNSLTLNTLKNVLNKLNTDVEGGGNFYSYNGIPIVIQEDVKDYDCYVIERPAIPRLYVEPIRVDYLPETITLNFKGSVDELPENAEKGDVYILNKDNYNYLYRGKELGWDKLYGELDEKGVVPYYGS